MRLQTRVDAWGSTLFAALGLANLVACGGKAGVDGATDAAGAPRTAEPDGTGAGARGLATDHTGAIAGGGASDTEAMASNVAGDANAHGGVGGASGGDQGTSGQAGYGTGGAIFHASFPCLMPTPHVAGFDTGYEDCRNGATHRSSQTACPALIPRSGPPPASLEPDHDTCKRDSECTAHPHGFCSTNFWNFGNVPSDRINTCRYGCVVDSDCGPKSICECGPSPAVSSSSAAVVVGICKPAECASDADCGPGLMCIDTVNFCGADSHYACQAPADACAGPGDCPNNQRCVLQSSTAAGRTCGFTCAPGRPFLVSGTAQQALLVPRSDWQHLNNDISPGSLRSAPAAKVLAERWYEAGLMEHASIAAFARFTLQLLNLGAPPSLIEDATAAIADETRHAKACFSIASAFGTHSFGPGSLSIAGSLDESSLLEIVLNTIREGCIGETVAALEAHEAAQHARIPAIRSALEGIAADEQRHAELAWRFLRWVLERADDKLRAAVENEFATAGAEEAPLAPSRKDDERLREGGILPHDLRAALRRQALARVIRPCALALLSGSGPTTSGKSEPDAGTLAA